jgi:hypothetical protein
MARNPGPLPPTSAGTAARLLTATLLLVGAVFVRRTMPLAANVDDHFRLYFGGYVGVAELRGGEEARSLRDELRATTRRIGDPYLASRFVTAQTPYSPLTTAYVAVAETVRPLLPTVRGVHWVLGVQTMAWLALLALALHVRRKLVACSATWFLAVGLALSWMHVHTSPFIPTPRATACLFTALALALAATGVSARWAIACVLLAAASHPYNQAIDLAVVLPAAAILAGTAAAPALPSRAAWRLTAVALGGVMAAILVMAATSPGGGVDLGRIWGERSTLDPAANWAASQPEVRRLSIAIGLPLAALVFRYAGWRRAAAISLLFAVTVIAAATLAPSGYYTAESVKRLGGAWVAFLFGLCLRADLLPDLRAIPAPRRFAIAAALVAVALPAAFPEVAHVQGTTHQPLRGWPGGLLMTVGGMGQVEAECMRIMRERSPRRARPRPAAAAQGERGSTAYTWACASANRSVRPGTPASSLGERIPSHP